MAPEWVPHATVVHALRSGLQNAASTLYSLYSDLPSRDVAQNSADPPALQLQPDPTLLPAEFAGQATASGWDATPGLVADGEEARALQVRSFSRHPALQLAQWFTACIRFQSVCIREHMLSTCNLDTKSLRPKFPC